MITLPLSAPYYAGGGGSDEVPGLYPVALNARPYLVDLKSGDFQRKSIPLLRNQADVANLPGEQSVNPEDLWRRAHESWHHGAGQDHFDRPDSDSARYRSSKGIDPWTKWQLSLLPEPALKKSTAATNLYSVVAGARLYILYGSTADASLHYTTTSTSTDDFTAATGTPDTPAVAATGLTSDGTNVWAAYGASGIWHHVATAAANTVAQRITANVGVIGYVKGRLMATGVGATANSIYNITANDVATTGATVVLPTALYTHPNTAFTWVGFAEGTGSIYAAGFSGDKSLIYRTTIRPDGTALDVPVVAGELPDGEIVRSIQGYLGFILVGTDKGVRFATADGNGNLTFGSLIDTNSAVRCFEPQDRFVWFGWSPYDASSTGLGRIDLSIFTGPLTPAYASDMMITSQANVLAVSTFGEKRIFAVSGLGFYIETTTKVASGTIDTGHITYGIHDNKMPMFVNVRTAPLAGSYSAAIAPSNGVFEDLGSSTVALTTSTSFQGSQEQSDKFELRFTLNRSTVDTTTGPTLIRTVLRSFPAAQTGEIFIVPLIFHESLEIGDQIRTLNPEDELNFIAALRRDHLLVPYQEGGVTHHVFVVDYEWRPHHQTRDGQYWQGTCVVKLVSLAVE